MTVLKIFLMAVFLFSIGGCKEKGTSRSVQPGAEGSLQTQEKAGSIIWVYNLAEGLKQAKKENKPLMVDFNAEWCGWCKKLDKEVFTDRTVVGLSERFVNVKVDTDKYPADARTYNIQGLPTVLFLNAEGQAVNQIIGYRDSEGFAQEMAKVVGL